MPDYTWDDFPVRPETPFVEQDRPRERVVRIGDARYLELPDNGWQLLFAWLAGPRRVCRRVDTTERSATTIERASGGKPARTRTEPRTEEDSATIDRIVNGYLREAGVPPRPRGFVWYLELPPSGTPRQIWNSIKLAARHGEVIDASQVRLAMAEAVEALYP